VKKTQSVVKPKRKEVVATKIIKPVVVAPVIVHKKDKPVKPSEFGEKARRLEQ